MPRKRRTSYFQFMGKYWSCPIMDYERLTADIERLGHVPDVTIYHAFELRQRPSHTRIIPGIEPDTRRFKK